MIRHPRSWNLVEAPWRSAGLAFLLVAVGAFAWWMLTHPGSDMPSTGRETVVSINRVNFRAVVALTESQQTKGLGGTTRLAPFDGMYFPLGDQPDSFWMKDMVMPIDIVWIDQHKVVGIDANAQPPQLGQADNQLKLYPPPVSQPDGVLEIGARRAAATGITVGSTVSVGQF